MIEEILSMIIITNDNLDELRRLYEKDVLSSDPETPVEFKVGKVIVTQTMHSPDLFDASFKCTRENNWIATREEFDARFVIRNDGHKTDTFALIDRK